MSSSQEKELRISSEEKLTLYMNSNPETFHTVISCMTGSNEYRDFLKKGNDTFAAFKKGLIDVSKSDGSIDMLIQFIKQSIVKNKRQLQLMVTELEVVSSGNALDIDNGANNCFALTDENKTENELWLSIPFVAIEGNRFDILDICFAAGVDINQFYWSNGLNALMHCLSMSEVNDELVTYLLQKKININAANENFQTALKCCIRNKNLHPKHKLELVNKLIACGANVNTCRNSFQSALHTYIDFHFGETNTESYKHWKEVIQSFITGGQDVNDTDWLGCTPLICHISQIPTIDDVVSSELEQVREIQLEIVEYLLSIGADPNIKDYSGRTCAHTVGTTLNKDVLNVLLKYKCDPNAMCALGMTPIYTICSNGNWEAHDDTEAFLFPIIETFSEAGCEINIKGMDGSTVLHYAAAKLSGSICRKLCELGADVSVVDYLGRTPLHMASRNNDASVVDTLLQYKAEINAVDLKQETPLHYACLMNNAGATKCLVCIGANIGAVGKCDIQPIHLAAENGNNELIEYFASKINVQALDEWGASPLHYAASDGNIESVEQLLKLGADKNITDNEGMRPIDLSRYRGHLKATACLADTDSDVRFGNLPINCFPNRPLLKKEGVDNYFSELTEKFLTDGITGITLAKQLLECQGLGKVNNTMDSDLITKSIINLVERICERIGQLDPLFKCKLLRAGSTKEGVKTGYPDEFDFVCHTESFSTNIDRVETDETEGFAKVILKKTAPREMLKLCSRTNYSLNSAKFLRYYTQLYRQATYDILSEGIAQIYTGYMLLPENANIFSGPMLPLTKLQGQSLSFRGELHKHIDVSIDLNPVLFINNLPKEMIKECEILPEIESMGVYLIPKYCEQFFQYPLQEQSAATDLWRYSTHHIEVAVMKRLPNIARDCYTLCKLFRMEPLTCSVSDDITDPIELSEKQLRYLHRMDKLSDEEDCFDNDDNDNENETTLSDNEITDKYPEESLMDEEKAKSLVPANTSSDINDDDSMSDDDDDDDDDDAWEEEEITAEKAIPSYYLKSLFIKEAEHMAKQALAFDEGSLSKIPRKVYEALYSGIKEKHLNTLFMPHHNIFQKFRSSDEARISKTSLMFCRNILKFMDKLGFKESVED